MSSIKLVDVRSKINVSTYFPAFERLHMDNENASLRRAVSTFGQGGNAIRPPKSTRYSTLDKVHKLDVIAKTLADIARVDFACEFSVEAQRVSVSGFDGGVPDLNGACVALCVNRYNVDGGLVGNLGFDPGFAAVADLPLRITPVRLNGSMYDFAGYLDFFLLHAH